jgi:hypothetical protein
MYVLTTNNHPMPRPTRNVSPFDLLLKEHDCSQLLRLVAQVAHLLTIANEQQAAQVCTTTIASLYTLFCSSINAVSVQVIECIGQLAAHAPLQHAIGSCLEIQITSNSSAKSAQSRAEELRFLALLLPQLLGHLGHEWVERILATLLHVCCQPITRIAATTD